MEASKPKFGVGTGVLVLLVALGFVLAIIRYFNGLGSITNLNDSYPWGFWKAYVFFGIALGAGGFTMACMVYVFQLKRYHAVIRPAVLIGLLGYISAIVMLLVDLGRYERIWYQMFLWQHHSALFEVGWCVFMYTIVLMFEFSSTLFERFRLEKVQRIVRGITPFVMFAMMAIFSMAVTGSLLWTAVAVALMVLFQILVWTGLFPDEKITPPLLVMTGVILSALHHSSLGTIFLIVPHKLSEIWHTPILPILFFLSAVAVGPAMVVFVSVLTSKVLRKELVDLEILSRLGRAIPYILGLYLLLRIADLVGRNAVDAVFTLNVQSVFLWLEIGVGVILPMTLLIMPEIHRNATGLLWSTLSLIVGVVLNRTNVCVVGIKVMSWEETYFPSWMEFAVSAALVAACTLAFLLMTRYFPVYEEEATSTV